MQNFTLFHQLVGEVLKHIGFEQPALTASQEIISIEIEALFTVNFGLIDQKSWFILAGIRPTDETMDAEHYPLWLRSNQIGDSELQPIVALDENNQLTCWLRLPLFGCDSTHALAAFDAVLGTAHNLL